MRYAQSADLLPGGLAAGIPDSAFDPVALARGTRVELEHTGDPALAREIAKDHLVERADYYDLLERLESSPAYVANDLYSPFPGPPLCPPGCAPEEPAYHRNALPEHDSDFDDWFEATFELAESELDARLNDSFMERAWREGLTPPQAVRRAYNLEGFRVDAVRQARFRRNQEPEEIEELLACSECEGPLFYLGSMGRMRYFRCSHCGSQHGYTAEELPPLPEEEPY